MGTGKNFCSVESSHPDRHAFAAGTDPPGFARTAYSEVRMQK